MDVRNLHGSGSPLSAREPLAEALPGWAGRIVVAEAAAELGEVVAAEVAKALRADPDLVLGLATGRTMEPVHAGLVRRLQALPSGELNTIRDHWRSFNLDEYVDLAPGDPRSFGATMRRQLGDPLSIPPERLQLPRGLSADPAAEALRYREAIAAAGGIGLQLLGLGHNGHVGFNEPPCLASAVGRCVELSPSTRLQNGGLFGGDPAAVPARAITLGLAEILQARRILLVVSGSSKAPILSRLLRESANPALPASWLQTHPHLQLWVDRAALDG
ncbi:MULTISPECIES: glucosamine-6-phosphate deaminase [unclassified Synechococcus]|uniref:glucosamine-6-phosphate deaminase n=1 Tax=unclassified Synechococcus TaxID=2626047 RepID=UPI0021A5DCAB|nr:MULTISPECIES: glucosamine-6-phosphate deaminase [unclassified Synechococcus]MCT0212275.1 glucosamine-6-phosphate deaminase [Synechococcus sp. CS-1326]MCT0234312.1 glucosamine-6-phosphate deaminase [Synechococcus sp. CS-1327]